MDMDRHEIDRKYEAACHYYKLGQYEDALSILDNINPEFPDNPSLIYAKALCLGSLKRYEEAVELCNRLIKEFHDVRGVELGARIAARIADTSDDVPDEPPAPVFRTSAVVEFYTEEAAEAAEESTEQPDNGGTAKPEAEAPADEIVPQPEAEPALPDEEAIETAAESMADPEAEATPEEAPEPERPPEETLPAEDLLHLNELESVDLPDLSEDFHPEQFLAPRPVEDDETVEEEALHTEAAQQEETKDPAELESPVETGAAQEDEDVPAGEPLIDEPPAVEEEASPAETAEAEPSLSVDKNDSEARLELLSGTVESYDTEPMSEVDEIVVPTARRGRRILGFALALLALAGLIYIIYAQGEGGFTLREPAGQGVPAQELDSASGEAYEDLSAQVVFPMGGTYGSIFIRAAGAAADAPWTFVQKAAGAIDLPDGNDVLVVVEESDALDLNGIVDASITRLTALQVRHSGLTDVTLAPIAGLSSLRELALEHVFRITDESLQHVGAIEGLECLRIQGAHLITVPGMENLKSLENIKVLDIEDTALGDEVAPIIAGYGQLQTLRLPDTCGDDAIPQIETLQQLEHLRLGLGVGTEALGSLGGIHSLRTLTLAGPVNAESAAKLATLPSLSSLTLLGEADAGGLSALAAAGSLTSLALIDAVFPAEELGDLANLRVLKLDLGGDPSRGVAVAKGIAGLTQLEALALEGPAFDDRTLEEFPALDSLRWLSLRGAAVTDTGIAALPDLPLLQTLVLDYTGVDASELTNAQAINTLTHLSLAGRGASQSLPREFEQEHPDLTVRLHENKDDLHYVFGGPPEFGWPEGPAVPASGLKE